MFLVNMCYMDTAVIIIEVNIFVGQRTFVPKGIMRSRTMKVEKGAM